MLGTVRWFNRDKGFGIIESNIGEDVFAHYTCIEGEGYKYLLEGESVEFEIEQGRYGPQAVQIKKSN